jgi:hypothetical protein
MSRVSRSTFNRTLAVISLALAFPVMAYGYVDPGTGIMLWQIAAALAVGMLFYVKRVFVWARRHLGYKSERAMGFAFATLFAVITSPVTMALFHSRPLPRFNDVFLVGIVLSAYLFTWESAVYLLLISLGVSAWILPPDGSLRVHEFADWYRLVSFALLSVFLVCVITRMKNRKAVRVVVVKERPFAMTRAAAAAD